MVAVNFKVEVNCPSTMDSLPFFSKMWRHVLDYLNEDQQTKIYLAIHEGLINAIEGSKKTDDIKLSIQKKADDLEIAIINYGEEVPQAVIEKASTLSFEDVLWEESGRGLLIINSIADEWSLSRDDKGRNLLKIKIAG